MSVPASAQTFVVLVTCANQPEAKRIATQVVRAHLAACVTIVPRVESIFWWKGKITRCAEVLLMMKTTAKVFERLRATVLRAHSYENPEIIALPIIRGHQPYLSWVQASTRAA